jgi:hypothetical protein
VFGVVPGMELVIEFDGWVHLRHQQAVHLCYY